MTRFRFAVAGIVVVASAFGTVGAQAQQLNMFGVMGAMPAIGNAGGNVAGSIIGVAMSTILQQLSEQERQNREVSLHKAATSGSASWKTAGQHGKTATYKKVGSVQTVGNQKCQKVQEKITLPNGEQGVSEENVCFN